MSQARLTICAAALALLPLAAAAQSASTFRCQGTDGKKYYGNTIPPQCYGRLVEQLNNQGMVIRRIDAEAKSDKDPEVAAAEKAAKDKLELANRETMRRNRALLATYTSEKDIEEQRGRALADNTKAVREQETRVADLKKRRASFDKELEFYQDKKGVTKAPPKLTEEIRQAEFDLKVQQDSLDVKRKEVDSINAKYDDDRKRYLELSGKNPAERGAALGMDKGATVTTKGSNVQEDYRNLNDAQRRASKERAEVERLEREQEAARRRSVFLQQQQQQQQRR
jgi:hypothetical protein